MRYLMREASLLSGGQWEQIDKAVIAEASKLLVGRRFLNIVGPMGAQVQNVPLDAMSAVAPASADFWGNQDTEPTGIASRRFVELVTVYGDFMISWRDIENENGAGVQAAREAAVTCARREDDLIFHGDKELGIDGLFTVKGANKIAISNWSEGENPVKDVAKAMETLIEKGCSGEYALIVSTDLYGKLHRIQSGTGLMELERVRSLAGKLYHSNRLEKNRAVMVCCEPQHMDLVIGQDMITAYVGNEKLDHGFRVMETLVPRIKRPSAIAIIG